MDGDEGERDGTGRRRTEPREGRNSYGRGIEWMTPRNDRLGPYENEYVIAYRKWAVKGIIVIFFCFKNDKCRL
jgi:hypothetical protein